MSNQYVEMSTGHLIKPSAVGAISPITYHGTGYGCSFVVYVYGSSIKVHDSDQRKIQDMHDEFVEKLLDGPMSDAD
jgi:hypothetical protein